MTEELFRQQSDCDIFLFFPPPLFFFLLQSLLLQFNTPLSLLPHIQSSWLTKLRKFNVLLLPLHRFRPLGGYAWLPPAATARHIFNITWIPGRSIQSLQTL